MNLSVTFLIPIHLTLLVFSASAHTKTFQVQIVEQPSSPNGMFTARVVAADFNDPTPNYCYKRSWCYYAGFANSKSWGEQGKQGYGTQDKVRKEERWALSYNAKTMGELAVALRDKGALYLDMKDYLGPSEGNDPTFCMYAYIYQSGWQQAGTLASNCSDAPPIPASCKLTPESLTYDWGTLPSYATSDIELTKTLSVTCTKPTDLKLSVSGLSVPLNGDSSTRAEFNLGSGWTGSTTINVQNTKPIEMLARLRGLEDRTGTYTGSSVMIMELN